MNTLEQLEQHDFGAVFPPPTEEEFDALCASIKQYGLHEPILIY